MQSYETTDGHVIIQLERGDYVLESITEACQEHDLTDGAVVSAIGTLRNLRVHILHTDDLAQDRSERNTIIERDGCWEISGIQGLVANGDPHLHVTAWDGEETIAGHLEERNEINALGEICVMRLRGVSLDRSPNEFGVSVLENRG